MRIQYLSDLHLELEPLKWPENPTADVVVLAGDIHVGMKGLEWALNMFLKPTIYIPGNHEFYEQIRPELIASLKQRAKGTHVFVLDQDAITIDGVEFFGATLWTDFCFYETPDLDRAYAQRNVVDFHIINEAAGFLFSPERSAALFSESIAWLDRTLKKSKASKRVVITHHAPSAKSVTSRFSGSPLNPVFASRLESFIAQHSVDLWIHGHMHSSLDYFLGKTRVVCNPRGYQPYEDDTGFELNKIAEV